MTEPLHGVRVVDATSTFLGPYCTLLMAQMGADVVKVEPPTGDITRSVTAGRSPGMSSAFLALNAGKRSIALDLKHELGREALRRLLEPADVFVHNMRPKAAERLEISYDSVAATNSGIVYCAAYGFGEDGPYAGRPAYDDIIQAASGLAALQGVLDGRPRYVASVIADKTCGLTALYAILAALFNRERTGRGARIDVPMFETMAAYTLLEQLGGLTFEPPEGPPGYARTVSPYRRPYETLDGYVSVMLYTDVHWRRFFDLTGHAHLNDDPRFASATSRSANIDAVYQFVDEILRTRTTADWLGSLTAIDVPAVAVASIEDLLGDPHIEAVGMLRIVDHPSEGPIRMLRNPVGFGGDDAPLHAPRLGEHGVELLEDAGLDGAVIRRMQECGALVGPPTT